MKKFFVILLAFMISLSFILPAGISYAEPAAQTTSEWAKLCERISESPANGTETIINLDKDIVSDGGSDANKSLIIKDGQTIILKGNKSLKGIGIESVKIDKGGKLVIDGPSISNAGFTINGEFILKNGEIKDNKFEGPTIFINKGIAKINGGKISQNEAVESDNPKPEGVKKGNYAPITIYSGTLEINDGEIIGNKGFHFGGAICSIGSDEEKSKIDINGGKINTNKAEHTQYNSYGGGIFSNKTILNINGGSINENTSEVGVGVYAVNSEINMTNGEINKNTPSKYSGAGGGFAVIESKFNLSGGSISENLIHGTGGGIYIEDTSFNMSGGEIINNQSDKSGGGVAFFGKKEEHLISGGKFKGNVARGFWGGGAIYNENNSNLKIMNALITNNRIENPILLNIGAQGKTKPSSPQGGGIWNCPTGHMTMNITKGVALFDNQAANAGKNKDFKGAGDDYAAITKYKFGEIDGKANTVEIKKRMLGGGERIWYRDGSFSGVHTNWDKSEQVERYNPEKQSKPIPYDEEITEKKGEQLVFKSVPKDNAKELARQVATTIIEDNTAQNAGISGGGIANNGNLIFGTPDTYKIRIEKNFEGDRASKRPKEIILEMFVGDKYVEEVKLTKEDNYTVIIDDFPDPDTLVDNKTGEVLPINFKEKNKGEYVLQEVSKVKDEGNHLYTVKLKNSIYRNIKIQKKWNDENDKDGIRPNEVRIALLVNGKQTSNEIILTKEKNWRGEFKNLPVYENEKMIEYQIKEIGIKSGYRAKINGNMENGFTITNTHLPDKPKTPKTGDNDKTIIYLSIILAMIGILSTNKILKDKKDKN